MGSRLRSLTLDRDGFAIPAAIFVIVVISLLAVSGLYVAQNNAAASVGIRRSWRAFYAANAGAAYFVATAHGPTYTKLEPGDSSVTNWRSLADGSQYRVSLLRVDGATRSDSSLFRLRTIGRPVANATAQRVIVTMVRGVVADELCCDGAMKVQGRLSMEGTGFRVKASGIDVAPVSWAGQCSGPQTDVPGVSILDTDDLKKKGKPTLEGDPPVQEDAEISDQDFTEFGGLNYADLAGMADKTFAGDQTFGVVRPVSSGGVCATDVPTNWGNPLTPGSPCWDYLPIIHVQGDARFSGDGVGQGILLVDGDLLVTGTFDFYGVIVVQGKADFRGTTYVSGGVIARNRAGGVDESHLRGTTTIQYSSCSASRALAQAIATRPLDGRHWFDVID